ncbi:MAG TPA: phosphatase PAP2 family protein [Abditibacteriaceae bacterium]
MVFWKLLSFLGSEEFYLLIMPALLWCVNARLGLRVGILFLLSANLNGALKLLFHAPRPAWVDAKIIAHAFEPSFGFPSGHAQNAVAVWGLLAAKAKKPLVWGISLVLCVFIGLSRLVLNVHFPGDVLGGWLFGALLLGAFLKWEKPVGAWLLKHDFIQQIVICGAVSALLIAVNWQLQSVATNGLFNALEQIPRPYQTPDATKILLQDLLSLNNAFKTAGALFGFLVGACWMLKNGGYVDGGNKILRYLIGVLGVAVFWYGLGKVLPRGEDIVSLGAAYMRYALVGFWISAGAPLVFRRIEKRVEL